MLDKALGVLIFLLLRETGAGTKSFQELGKPVVDYALVPVPIQATTLVGF